MIEGVRIARKLLSAPEFDKFQGSELYPGEEAQTDEEILEFLRERAETIYHPIGTCKWAVMTMRWQWLIPNCG